jgi:uncharacterized membrane protein
MTLKKYQQLKIVLVILISIIFSQAIFYNNYIIPVAVLIISSLLLMLLRRKVKEVIADERDYATAGKSALLALQVYSWAAAIGMFILYALRDTNPSFEPIAITLAFSTCTLMLIYSLLFRYHNGIKFTGKKLFFKIFVIALLVSFTLVGIRLFSGEDNWVCQNSQWVKHGNPSFPAPLIPCK